MPSQIEGRRLRRERDGEDGPLAQHHPAHGFGQEGVIDKAGIDEFAVMLESVIAGMVDAAGTAFAAIAEIDGLNSQMLQEG